ncbi:MAG TPA: DUF3806 domain-containing protein [Candidatus Didemnitutus sp.]|nr:DUF3806 domain-containing protein [Candidatus Didemnitutus sp.]
MDIEIPARLKAAYEKSGALALWDDSGAFTLRFSGITAQPKDLAERDACLREVIADAAKKGLECVRVSDPIAYYRETKEVRWDDGPGKNEFWFAGFGNRELVATLTYFDADLGKFDLGAERRIVVDAIRSIALAFPDHEKPTTEPLVFDVRPSQQLWFSHHRADMARRIQRATGYDSDELPPLSVLDDYWSKFIGAGESDNDAVNMVLNGIAVLFGDHLARGKGFEWAIVSDAYGVCLAVVKYRGSANLNVDPFNFVVKRWQKKEHTFLANGYAWLCDYADKIGADLKPSG